MIIVWDEPKRRTNLRVHGLDLADAAERFDFSAAVIRPSYGGRFSAIGALDGALVAVAFRPLGREGLSLISLRIASAKERKLYAEF